MASEVINQSAGSHLMGGGGSCERGEGDDMTPMYRFVVDGSRLSGVVGSLWQLLEGG